MSLSPYSIAAADVVGVFEKSIGSRECSRPLLNSDTCIILLSHHRLDSPGNGACCNLQLANISVTSQIRNSKY